ncbi:hypothetical protein NOMA109596_06750 [Nocardioides marinus]
MKAYPIVEESTIAPVTGLTRMILGELVPMTSRPLESKAIEWYCPLPAGVVASTVTPSAVLPAVVGSAPLTRARVPAGPEPLLKVSLLTM